MTQQLDLKMGTLKVWVAMGDEMLQEDTLILDRPRALSRFQTGVPKQLGRFHLDGILGQGGMANVYRGHYQGIHGFTRPVAIKVAKPHPTETNLLKREARLLAKVRHPNIIQIIDAGEESGHAYYAMDWIDGWTLKQLLTKNGALPPVVCIEIAQQLCHALASLHDRSLMGMRYSIVHGDVKPANIMLNGNGWVRLLDFGIASVHDPSIRPPSYGTAAYIAPEQLGTNQPDVRSDIFSLGAVLYEMATGERLFKERDISSLVRKRVELERHINRSHMSRQIQRCHPALISIIHRCTQGSPSKRFQSADCLGSALGDAKNQISKTPGLRRWIQFM